MTVSVVLAVACGSSHDPYDGEWQGTTSQGRPMSFTVKHNGLVRFEVSIRPQGATCSGSQRISGDFPFATGIRGQVISIKHRDYELHGTIAADGTASGSFSYLQPPFGPLECDARIEVTWSARRNAGPAESDAG